MKHDQHASVTLAICRDEAAFRSVMKKRHEFAGYDLVIASDDWRVHAAASGQLGDDLRVVWIDQSETFFDAAPHVLELLDGVNAWLRDQADRRLLPEELLYWVQHVEGGSTTQRISDAVLEARSLFRLIDRFKPQQLVIGAALTSFWEDDVVASCATQRRLPVRHLGHRRPRSLLQSLWLRLRPFVVEAYQLVLALDALARRKASVPGSHTAGRFVAIQMCTRGAGHFANTLPLLDALERERLHGALVTFRVGRMANAFRAQGYAVVELEAWLTAKSLVRSSLAALAALRRMAANKAAFLPDGVGGEYAQAIRSVLLNSMRGFFVAELPQLIRLDAACRNFFSRYPPVAARLWTNILYEGVVTFRAMAALGVRPLIFRQVGLDLLANPYLRHDVPVDLYFCTSGAAKDRLRDEGERNCEIVVAGSPSRQRIADFASSHTTEQSRALLGIPATARFVVFCDAQAVVKGYFSPAEQEQLVLAVLEFAERHEDVCVILKPHPTYQPGPVEATIKGRGCGRLVWMSANELPSHALNVADVVLTKFSTMTADAMVLGVPAICVLLDQDRRWAIYQDAVDYAMTIEELTQKLDALRDPGYRLSWRNALRPGQSEFLARHFPKPTENNFELVARKVREAVDMRAAGNAATANRPDRVQPS